MRKWSTLSTLIPALEAHFKSDIPNTPENKLMLALIVESVAGWLRGDKQDTAWLFDDDYYPWSELSFTNICDALGLDPEEFRKALKTRTDEVRSAQFIKMSFREAERESRPIHKVYKKRKRVSRPVQPYKVILRG